MVDTHHFRVWAISGLAVVVLVVASGRLHAGEAVFETSFEDEMPLDGWSVDSNNPAAVTSKEARSGAHSLKISPGTSTHRGRALPDTASPDDLVRVDFWAKGGAGAYIDHTFAANPDWTRQRRFIRVPQRNSALVLAARSSSQGLYVDDIQVAPATGAEYRSHLDQHLSAWGQPPVLNQASRTLGRLDRTMQALRDGDPWKIVMLGDSIQNDTYKSNWDALLRDRYQQADVEVVKSVRGSTGMDWYAADVDENDDPVDRLQEWVLDHDPDMLMLGGISHGQDAEAYRSVIERVRQDTPDTEFLIMSGLAGGGDPSQTDWTFEPTAEDDPFRHALMQIAADEGAGFLDARALWNQYVTTSNQPLDFFKRDPVHTNTNGQLVAASIVDQYFGQPIPEPSSAALLIGTAALLATRRAAGSTCRPTPHGRR